MAKTPATASAAEILIQSDVALEPQQQCDISLLYFALDLSATAYFIIDCTAGTIAPKYSTSTILSFGLSVGMVSPLVNDLMTLFIVAADVVFGEYLPPN
eukprot:4292820-Ditylum_brightwellii.AAC.1